MFLAIDESTAGGYTTLGCVCIPIEHMPSLENRLINFRIKEKVWGELKWDKLSKSYKRKYGEFLKTCFEEDEFTFHSWTYLEPSRHEISKFHGGDRNKVKYRHAYLLIRSIIWKTRNYGYKGTYHILADENGSLGIEEYKKTHEILCNDRSIRPSPQIDLCTTGSSHVCAALQLSDNCTGAVAFTYAPDSKKNSDNAEYIINLLRDINNNVPINISSPTLPNLNDFRLHHCLFSKPAASN